MNTLALIEAAEAAKAADLKAATDLSLAATVRSQAAAVLVAANQALHDDLAANGPAAVMDTSVTPPTVTMYTAVDPDSWQAIDLRVAA